MILCLSCHALSPSGSIYCWRCGRSFGGRRCRARHLSPRPARSCSQCGSRELSQPTGSLGLGWLTRLLAWLVALLLLRVVLTYLDFVLGALWWAGSLAFGLATGASLARVASALAAWVLTLLTVTAILRLVRPKWSPPSRVLAFVPRATLRAMFGLSRLVARGLVVVVEGRTHK